MPGCWPFKTKKNGYEPLISNYSDDSIYEKFEVDNFGLNEFNQKITQRQEQETDRHVSLQVINSYVVSILEKTNFIGEKKPEDLSINTEKYAIRYAGQQLFNHAPVIPKENLSLNNEEDQKDEDQKDEEQKEKEDSYYLSYKGHERSVSGNKTPSLHLVTALSSRIARFEPIYNHNTELLRRRLNIVQALDDVALQHLIFLLAEPSKLNYLSWAYEFFFNWLETQKKLYFIDAREIDPEINPNKFYELEYKHQQGFNPATVIQSLSINFFAVRRIFITPRKPELPLLKLKITAIYVKNTVNFKLVETKITLEILSSFPYKSKLLPFNFPHFELRFLMTNLSRSITQYYDQVDLKEQLFNIFDNKKLKQTAVDDFLNKKYPASNPTKEKPYDFDALIKSIAQDLNRSYCINYLPYAQSHLMEKSANVSGGSPVAEHIKMVGYGLDGSFKIFDDMTPLELRKTINESFSDLIGRNSVLIHLLVTLHQDGPNPCNYAYKMLVAAFNEINCTIKRVSALKLKELSSNLVKIDKLGYIRLVQIIYIDSIISSEGDCQEFKKNHNGACAQLELVCDIPLSTRDPFVPQKATLTFYDKDFEEFLKRACQPSVLEKARKHNKPVTHYLNTGFF